MFCLLELSRAFSTELCVLSDTNGGFDKVDGTARMKDQPSISGAPAHSSDNSCLQQGKSLFSPQISYLFQQKTHDCMQRNVLHTRAVEHIRLVFVSKVLSPQWKVSMHYYTITEQPRSNVRLKMRACDWLVCMTSSYILHSALSSMDSFSLCFSFFPMKEMVFRSSLML